MQRPLGKAWPPGNQSGGNHEGGLATTVIQRPFVERGVPPSGLARRLLFFSRRRRRFVLGMRRALMRRLRRPLTLCRRLMMSGRRGWPALRVRRSRVRRGSRPRFRGSRALMRWLRRPLTLCHSLMMSGWRGCSALRVRRSRMRSGSGPRFRRSRACMLSRYGSGRLGFSLGRICMRRGRGFGFRASRIRMCGRRGLG